MRVTVGLLMLATTLAVVWIFVGASRRQDEQQAMARRIRALEERVLRLAEADAARSAARKTGGLVGEDRPGEPRFVEAGETAEKVAWVGPRPTKAGDCVLPQPAHQGKVLAVDEAAGTCVISLGAEDGVKEGFCYVIVRGDDYVATIRIRAVQAKQSSGAPIEELSKDDIRAGDRARSGA